MRQIFTALVMTMLFYACQEKQSEHVNYTHHLTATDSISFKNPPYSYYMSWYNQLAEDTLIRKGVGENNTLELIDLKNQKFIDIYKFKKVSDLGVGNINGFKYINQDSVFLFNQTQLIITNIDNDTINNVYDIKGDYDGLWYPLSLSNGSDIVYRDKKMYFGKNDFEYTNTNAYYDSPLLMELDLESNTTRQFKNIHFPEEYYDKCWQDNLVNFSISYNPKTEKFIFNFPISHQLHVFDPKNNELTKHHIQSKFVNADIESMKCDLNDADPKKKGFYLFKTSHYYKNIYDPYRDVYYIIVKHGVSDEEAVKLADNFYGTHGVPFSIMVVDKNFNVIGETTFKKKTYTTGDFFVGPKGLYLQKNNTLNPDFDENIIKYDILTPTEIK
ncbi:MAG: DUF4221 domain-containing protein [Psychroflexus sp.]|nr:DUF4221 domain-containing protein [Psychroflexus sp.]